MSSVGDSPFIRSITERPSLPPSSLLRCLVSVLCSSPSLAGKQRGYFVHRLDHSGSEVVLHRPVVHHPRQGNSEPLVPDHLPFGPSLTASLACLPSRPFTALHLG